MGEKVAIAFFVALAVVALAEATRAKGARVFDRGANGETGLMFDPATKPKA